MSDERMLTGAEVAAIFQVRPGTVSRWARNGLLPFRSTPGGRRQYPEAAVRQLAATRGGNST